MFDWLTHILLSLATGFLYLIGGLLVIFIPLWVITAIQFRWLARKRKGLSICQFARSFDYRRVDTKIIRAAYEGVQYWGVVGVKNFPVMVSDDVYKIYGFDSEDLEDLGQEIAGKTGRSWKDAESNPLYGSVNTVRDLVLFLNFQPKLNA